MQGAPLIPQQQRQQHEASRAVTIRTNQDHDATRRFSRQHNESLLEKASELWCCRVLRWVDLDLNNKVMDPQVTVHHGSQHFETPAATDQNQEVRASCVPRRLLCASSF